MQKFLRPILVAAFALALFTASAVAQVSSFGGASSGGGSSFPLTANVSAAGYKIQSLGAGAASGDALSYAQTSAILDGLGLDGSAVDFDALDLNSTATGANPWRFYSSGTGTGAPWGAGGFGISKSTTNLFGIEASGAIVTGTSNTQITNAAGTLRAAALDNGAWAVPGAIGGTTPGAGTFANINQVNNQGSQTSAVTCNFSLGAICVWNQGANTVSVTASNLPTDQWVEFIATVSGVVNINFGANVEALSSYATFGYGTSPSAFVEAGVHAFFGWSDGTDIWLAPSDSMAFFGNASALSLWVANAYNIAAGNFYINNSNNQALHLQNGGLFSVSLNSGTSPTLTAGCNGAGSSVAAGSTDNRGTFTGQTTATASCTLTFNHTWPQAPFCVATDGSGGTTKNPISVGTASTTAVSFYFASTANQVVNYMCM